jgi:hypothetical protein
VFSAVKHNKYNRKVRNLALMAALCLLAACKHDIQNIDAVRGSIVDYLKQRQPKTGLNMDLMKVDVLNLAFSSSGNEAHVTVMFTPKAGGSGMQLPYTLDRKGDKWVVRARAEGGENPHAGAGLPALPPSHPPVTPTEKQP